MRAFGKSGYFHWGEGAFLDAIDCVECSVGCLLECLCGLILFRDFNY